MIILLISSCLIGQADTWRSDDGLSNEWISDIVQDENGYLWVATQYGLNKFDGYEFETINYAPNDSNSLSANWVRNLALTRSGEILLNCSFGKTHRLDPTSGAISLLNKGTEKLPKNVRVLYPDSLDNIWIGSPLGVYKIKQGSNISEKITQLNVRDIDELSLGQIIILSKEGLFRIQDSLLERISTTPSFSDIQQIFVDHRKQIWALSTDKLYTVNIKSNVWSLTEYKVPDFNKPNVFYKTAIYEDGQNRIWLAGETSLSIISSDRKKIDIIPLSRLRSDALNDLEIIKICEDKDDNVWLGTNKGLNLISPLHTRFREASLEASLQEIAGAREILIDNSTAFLGTESGLYELDLNDSSSPPIKLLKEPTYALCKTVDGKLFVGTNKDIFLRTSGSNTFQKITTESFAGGITWDMEEDNEGSVWFSSTQGLSRYDPINKTFIKFTSKNNSTLDGPISQDIVIDKEGNLWGGTLTVGVYKLLNTYDISDSSSAIFENYRNTPNDSNSLSSNIVQSMTMSSEGSIWVGTDGGLNKINKNGKIEQYLKSDGLKDDKFMSLHVDKNNILWGSTIGHGVMALNLASGQTTFFNKQDGLKSNNFLINSGFLDSSGILYLGSDAETQVINTNTVLQIEPKKTHLTFTTINILSSNQNGQSIKQLKNDQSIEIPFNSTSFNVSFSTIQYFKPYNTEYSYRILPQQEKWQSNGSSRKVNFNGLKEGQYVLEVSAKNPLLKVEPEIIRLEIIVLPPWWRTNWAYAIYALGLLGLLSLFIKRQKEISETNKLKELNDLKTKLYTNITHEIRTPLTVILGLSKKLMGDNKKSISSTSEIIHRNGNHLLLLVNRILDLSKIESGKMPVQLEQQDIIGYLSYLLESFHSWAEDKDIRIHFLPKEDEVAMDFDKEIMKQIINNLMSNAIKFSPVGGDIYCEIEKQNNHLSINIKDSGVGVDKEKIDQLFERFYQEEAAQNSSGIGLAITKELVQLLNGDISVQNNSKKGCTFSVRLPISKKAPTTRIDLKKSIVNQQALFSEELETILVIEDNTDVREFLVESLNGQFRVVDCSSGQEGVDMCIEHIPDLVISDIMMPGMDGFEVCQRIKSDQRTNHIPVILLTAKADRSSKLMGLEKGADDYLIKPFDAAELEIRIANLLTVRKNLRLKYQQDLLSDKAPSEGQDPFVVSVIGLIDSNLSDSNFGIVQICRKLGISRVHLHRKLKAITGESTSIFIRNIRLNRAHHMLRKKDKNVSEVAYDAGFNDPAYFSKLYSKKYGIPPSKEVTHN